MGKAVHQLLLDMPQHRVVACLDQGQGAELDAALEQSQVVVEFTRPESAVRNILYCMDRGVAVVCGTTGWWEQLERVRAHCAERQGALLYAGNFSIGVNLFFLLNEYLAGLMDGRMDYSAHLQEIHHLQKLDAPSGTAIALAQGILAQTTRYKAWHLQEGHTGEPNPASLPIEALRQEGVVGTHSVRYASPIDEIEILHRAHNREGFARGAIAAAEWLPGRRGIFTMRDCLFGV